MLDTTKKNIMIAGAGFGGITAALLLDKAFRRQQALFDQYNLVLVNNHHSHLYTPALYEIAAIPQGHHALDYVKSSIAIPLAEIFNRTHVQWLENQIIAIDRAAKVLRFDNDKSIPYEYLILALGAETSYFNIPGAKEHSFPLKTFADGVKLRDRIQEIIESTEPVATVVVAGAGASGVEVAAEFENFCSKMRRLNPAQAICKIKVILVEAGPQILAGFDPWVIDKATKRLLRIGVEIKTGVAITAVENTRVILKDGSAIPASALVWAGGVQAAGVLKTLGLPLSPKGSVTVDQFLCAEPKVYAIGDNAGFMNLETQKPLPWNAVAAEEEARVASANIIADILGSSPRPYNPPKKYPFILAVGKKYAFADLVFVHISGLPAWLLKQLIELKYFFFILPPLQALSTWWKYITVARSND